MTGETNIHPVVSCLEEKVGLGRPMLHLCIRLTPIYSYFFPQCNGTVVHACLFILIKRECEFAGCSFSLWTLIFHLFWFNLINSWKEVSFETVLWLFRIRFSSFRISLVLHWVVQKQLFWINCYSNSTTVTPLWRWIFKKVMWDCWGSSIT